MDDLGIPPMTYETSAAISGLRQLVDLLA